MGSWPATNGRTTRLGYTAAAGHHESKKPSGREISMAPVVCAVPAPKSREVVQAAVVFCLDRSADLRLVGSVEDKLSDSTRATGGERVRRYKHTRQELDRAVETARVAGVVASMTMRAG